MGSDRLPSRARSLLAGALLISMLACLPPGVSSSIGAEQESPPAIAVEVEPLYEAQVSTLSNSDQDYTSLNRAEGYAQVYLRTLRRNSSWINYYAVKKTLVTACAQAPETLASHLPGGLEYRASGKQVLFELLGGYPVEQTGTVYCQNVGSHPSAAYLTGAGGAELIGPTAVRLDLTRGKLGVVSVLTGRVLFTPSGEVPWLTDSFNVEAGQSATLNLATQRSPSIATYDPTRDDRETFEALQQRVLQAGPPSDPIVPGRITVEDLTPLRFDSQPVGTPGQPKSVLVANPGQTSTNLSARSLTPDFRVDSGSCPSTLSPSGSCALSVTFVPAGRGTRSGTLEINSSSLLVPLRIPLTGVGVQ